MDWGYGSSGREATLQGKSPESNPSTTRKKEAGIRRIMIKS
jgi:hypothetical protein